MCLTSRTEVEVLTCPARSVVISVIALADGAVCSFAVF